MVFGLMFSLFGQVAAANNPIQKSRGWGNRYKWMTLEDGLEMASRYQKPLMVIIHSMTCSSCIKLKRKFSKDEKIFEMRDKFIMVNLEHFEVPSDISFAPDGFYVPRILFFTPSGHLMHDVANKYVEGNNFAYSDPSFLTDSMVNAVNLIKQLKT